MPLFVPKLKKEGLLDHLHFTIVIVGSRKMRDEDDYGNGIGNILAPIIPRKQLVNYYGLMGYI